MKTTIVKGLTKEQISEMEASFNAGARFRDKLVELLMARIEDARKGARSRDAYSSNSWAYLQADAIGYERALFETISLISTVKNLEK